MTAFKMRLDVSRCIGCRACEVACVTANDLNPDISRNWVPYLEEDDGAESRAIFAPYLCHQCEDPPCVPACPTGASFIAADGRVLVDRGLCIGCGMCVAPCPYEARRNDPVASKLEKCDLCEGRVKAGLAPACFSTCPAGARIFEEEVEIDGRKQVVAVGGIDDVDPGSEVISLVTAEVDPKPRLVFSGRRADLDVLMARRPPLDRMGLAGALWRGGTGMVVQLLGYASILAMGTMIGLRALRSRSSKVAAESATARDEVDGRVSIEPESKATGVAAEKEEDGNE